MFSFHFIGQILKHGHVDPCKMCYDTEIYYNGPGCGEPSKRKREFRRTFHRKDYGEVKHKDTFFNDE